jgi:hypothetical protein
MARIVADSFLAVTAELGNDTAQREVRWFVMGDDDAVFFPDNLLTMLRKYDQEVYYVWALSESVEQDVIHSYSMAFGTARRGAGAQVRSRVQSPVPGGLGQSFTRVGRRPTAPARSGRRTRLHYRKPTRLYCRVSNRVRSTPPNSGTLTQPRRMNLFNSGMTGR